MEEYYIINVPPQTSPRPRVTRRGWTFLPEWYKHYQQLIMDEITKMNLPLMDYTEIEIVAYFKYPKTTSKKHLIDNFPMRKKPDYDNMAKVLTDCLEKLHIIVNDAQIYKATITKLYTTNEEGRIEFKLK